MVETDWSKSRIFEVVEDILETKKNVLCRRGAYSHVSGIQKTNPYLR